MNQVEMIAKTLKNITAMLSRGGADSPVYSVNGQAPDKTGNADLSYMARQDKLNNFAVTPTIQGQTIPRLVGGGGRNLVSGSKADWTHYQGWKTPYLTATGLTPGEMITVQFEVANPTTNVIPMYISYASDGSVLERNRNFAKVFSSDMLFIQTLAVPENCVKMEIFIGTQSDATAFDYRHEMLERGVVAHDWVPSPEDIQSQIDALKAQLNALKA